MHYHIEIKGTDVESGRPFTQIAITNCGAVAGDLSSGACSSLSYTVTVTEISLDKTAPRRQH